MSQNLRDKRQNITKNAIIYSTQLVDALNGLLELQAERALLAEDFQDTDFNDNGLNHITAGMIGNLFDFVTPSLAQNFMDDADGGRNRQILLQMRR